MCAVYNKVRKCVKCVPHIMLSNEKQIGQHLINLKENNLWFTKSKQFENVEVLLNQNNCL